MHGNEPSLKIKAATSVGKLRDLSVPFVLMCHVCLDKNVCSVPETPNVIMLVANFLHVLSHPFSCPAYDVLIPGAE